jgi:hypothetical protein
MSQWIPVDERLPDHHGTVVCRTQDRQLQLGRVMTICTYSGGNRAETYHWRGYPDCQLEVTHWFPLPDPPEVK